MRSMLQGSKLAVGPLHLFRYLDEKVFRHNNRATKGHFIGDGDRFQMAMRHIANRRIAYGVRLLNPCLFSFSFLSSLLLPISVR
jgi:hypothetical protein